MTTDFLPKVASPSSRKGTRLLPGGPAPIPRPSPVGLVSFLGPPQWACISFPQWVWPHSQGVWSDPLCHLPGPSPVGLVSFQQTLPSGPCLLSSRPSPVGLVSFPADPPQWALFPFQQTLPSESSLLPRPFSFGLA